MTECILHIGLEKTGTTSIQSTLAAHRELLLSRGVLYPRALGERSHVRAYAYASEGPPDEIKIQCGLGGSRPEEAFRRDLRDQLEAEIQDAHPNLLVVSNEHLSSRLLSLSEISRLKALLEGHCETIRVVVYLRAQGDAHRSAYSTYVKTGGCDVFRAPGAKLLRDRYLYDVVLSRWATVFGDQAMDVRLFGPDTLPGADVFADFADLLAARIAPSEFRREPHKNVSLDAFTLEFLRLINPYVPYKDGTRMSEMRGNLHDLVEAFAQGPPFEGDPAIIAEIDASVAESNEGVRRKYFPDRDPPLFPPTPSPVSASAPTPPAIPDEAVRLMAFLWEAKQAQVLQLKRRLENRSREGDRRRGDTSKR